MISVITPISIIPSHPDTDVIEETISSVRVHLPDAEIILMFDGLRPQQEEFRDVYEEHIRRVLRKKDGWGNVIPVRFDEHSHQVRMIRHILPDIRTPLLMYVEQDTPLVTDLPIDWDACINMITSGEADSVRFHHEAVVPDVHQYLMHGLVGDFIRTSQYSGRPHIASVAYYRRFLTAYFSEDARCSIEPIMWGVCDEAWNVAQRRQRDGMKGWAAHKLWIYHPEGNICRSRHLDGRDGAPGYDEEQHF